MSKKDERKPKPPHLPQETPEDGPDETKGREVEHVTVNIDFDNVVYSYTARKNGWAETALIPVTLEILESDRKVEMGFCLTQPKENEKEKIVLFDLQTGINIGIGHLPIEKDENFLDYINLSIERLVKGYLSKELWFGLHAAMLTTKLEKDYGPRPEVKQDIPKHLH